MTDVVQLAKQAREQLAAALNALQNTANVPEELMEVADPIAEAMSVFHRIERSQGTQLDGRAEALGNVRGALDRLQRIEAIHPAVDAVMEAVAGSLSKAHALSRYQPPAAAPAPLPVPVAAPAPVASPTPAPAPAPAPAPVFAPIPSAPSAAPIPRPAAAPAPSPIPGYQASATLPIGHPHPAVVPQPVVEIAAPAPQPVAASPMLVPVEAPAAAAQYPSSGAAAAGGYPAAQYGSPPAAQYESSGVAAAAGYPAAPASHHDAPPAAAQYQSSAAAYTPPVAYTPPQQPASSFSAPDPYQQPTPSGPDPYQQATAPAPEPYHQPAPAGPGFGGKGGSPAGGKGGATIVVELGTRSTSNFYKGLAGNDVVEHGGIFVATYKIPKIGSTVTLHILMPGNYDFHATAVVQWVREPRSDNTEPGFGARIVDITSDGRQLVYRYARNREPLFYDDL